MRVRITGVGSYLPERRETAEDIAPRIGKSAQWIREQTGVAERRIADEPIEVMAAHAAREALGGGAPPDLLLNASATSRQAVPDTSTFIAHELGLAGIPCHTVHATCLSFLAAFHAAAAYVTVGAHRRVLVVSSEIASTSRAWDEPESASLFGDGAGAAVVEATPEGEGSELLAYDFRTWPEHRDLARFEGGGTRHHPSHPDTRVEHHRFRMDGPTIYKVARRRVAVVLRDVLRRAHIEQGDVDLVVPHQPSGPALAALERYGFAPERTVNIVGDHGNCVAASIPMALAVAARQGRLVRGQRVLLIGTGAGLSVGAALLRW